MRASIAVSLLLAACSGGRGGPVPDFAPADPGSAEMRAVSMPYPAMLTPDAALASTWAGGPGSLLDDRRARQPGDILTVVIEIDDRAEFESSGRRSRSDAQRMGVNGLFGLPQRADAVLPPGASLGSAVDTSSSSEFQGSGSVSRSETLELRIAAVVTARTPAGVLAISGSQQVRVNAELRELLVTGYVRPEDISRRNEVEYDRIASARISYGGRGRVSEVQQPRYGSRLADTVLPF